MKITVTKKDIEMNWNCTHCPIYSAIERKLPGIPITVGAKSVTINHVIIDLPPKAIGFSTFQFENCIMGCAGGRFSKEQALKTLKPFSFDLDYNPK